MKAAVLLQLGASPVFTDYPEPQESNSDQVLIDIKAASVKNLDKLRASGKHYASYTELPAVVGIDGVGVLPDGTRVYAQGITGMLAEKGIISKNRYTVLPDHLDFVTAAALPNAVLGATMALKARAKMQKGETVLINGATGVTGQLAVQVAKYYGAGKIIVTGRNPETLNRLQAMGADHIIPLTQDEDAIIASLKAIHLTHPIDIVIDYLWGKPIEWIIKALKGGGISSFTSRVRIVTVGGMAGDNINLSSGTLRSSAIEILGSGLGSLSANDLKEFDTEILPEMFQLAADGKLTIATQTESLANIEIAWTREIAAGHRLVICIE